MEENTINDIFLIELKDNVRNAKTHYLSHRVKSLTVHNTYWSANSTMSILI